MDSRRPLALISDEEWIRWRWVEVTEFGDEERHFIQAGERAPNEAADAKRDVMLLRRPE